MKNRSLKFLITFYLVLFIVIVLSILAIFQHFTLDSFYRHSRIESLENAANRVWLAINSTNQNLAQVLKTEAIRNDCCVRVLTNGLNAYAHNEKLGCDIGEVKPENLAFIFKQLETKDSYLHIENNLVNNDQLFVYASIANINNQNVIVLTSARILPYNSTTSAIQKQFLIYFLIIILCTIGLGLSLSKSIIKPLKQISKRIKGLSHGHYEEVSNTHNISEIVELNKELSKANNKVIESENSKRKLLANISHDLKTPLTMIVGYAEMIRDIETENNPDNINVIINEAQRLSYLVNDLLDLSSFRDQRINLHYENIEVNTLLTNVFNQFQSTFVKHGIIGRIKLLDEALKIKIDQLRIKQVLYNFINNALMYNDKTEKIIELGAVIEDNHIQIYVYDNGIGIAQNEYENVFNRYYRAKNNHLRFTEGSGIGLALSREILVAHGLKYGIDSEVGQFSKFYFYLEIVYN